MPAVESPEVFAGDEGEDGPGDGVEAEEVRDGEAEEYVLEELRREEGEAYSGRRRAPVDGHGPRREEIGASGEGNSQLLNWVYVLYIR